MGIAEKTLSLKASLPSGVKLVAVSKFKPSEDILEAYNIGQKDFGENYVQELVKKASELPSDIVWHFIGHLQTNKVKLLVPVVSVIQSVDSLKLLKEINKEASKIDKCIECFLQVHIAEEETKTGLNKEELYGLLSNPELNAMQNIRLTGLMGMSTFTDNLTQVQTEFSTLKQIFDDVASKHNNLSNFDFKELSMGMSGDWQLAAQEGSTMVRVGSTIFGNR